MEAASSAPAPSPSSSAGTGPPAPAPVPACNFCRKAHTACDPNRPCGRCVRTGRARLCADPPPRKRGRRALRDSIPLASLSSSSAYSSSSSSTTTPSYAKLPLPTTTTTTAATSPGLLLHHHHHVAGIPFLQPGHRHHPPPLPPPVVLSSARGGTNNPGYIPQPLPRTPHTNVSTPKATATTPASASAATKFETGGAGGGGSGNMTVESLVGRIEVMSQVVEMQAEEIRQLRQTTARLETKLARRKAAHSESRQLVEELRERQREAEQEHARKRRKVEERLALAATKPTTSTSITGASSHSITSSSSSSSSSPSPSSTSSPLAVPVSANAAIGGLQSEIHRRMPFLRHYDIRASAIINFSYPVCSFELPGPGGFTDAPPVLVYANAAFCHLTNYPLERLLGTPYHFTYVINLQHYKQAMVIGNNRPPFGVTEVYKYQSLLRCDGCLLRVDQNHQFFCDESGKLRYSLLCITDWDEGRLGETEILGQWLPPSAIGITADGAAAAPEPPPPLQPQLQPPPVPTMSLPLSLELMPPLLPPPHQQPQLIYPAHEQQQHDHHHHHHPALRQQHPPPAYPLNHLQNQHQHPHQTHPQLHQQQQQHRPPPHPNAVQSDAEMAGWLMASPYPSESWPSV